jgi:hypothetical protein
MESFIKLQKPEGTSFTIVKDTLINEARNIIASNAIKGGFDRVMWFDSDMKFAPDTLIKLSAQMDNRPTRNLAIDALKLSSTPFPGCNPDDDIFNIMWSKQESQAFLSQQIRDKYYFAPKVEVLNSDAPKRNVLFQGGSFVHSLVYYWRNYIGECKQIYYNGTVSDYVNGTAKNPLTDGNEYWEDMLSNIDYVLFEATEQQLAYLGNNTGHWLMYNSLYEYLKNHEIK